MEHKEYYQQFKITLIIEVTFLLKDIALQLK